MKSPEQMTGLPDPTYVAIVEAFRRFTRESGRKVSVGDLAKAAGTSRASVYARFPKGNEDVAGALQEMVLRGVEERMQAELAGVDLTALPPQALARRAIHVVLSAVAEQQPFMRESLEWRLPVRVHERATRQLATWLLPIFDLIGDEVPDVVERPVLATFLAAGAAELLIQWILSADTGGQVPFEEFERSVYQVMPTWLVGEEPQAA
ncbi:TetR/AcrR family transcriptional regulator [Brachybacterium sp. EF45031]|uniref:TetR/AcrR family transcriptional regulator n=1 Tax=Brachybacterium sillae TaxID=2810536 RepID=UPI00217D6B66|nr:TetR/AcrR family transcriptional regulator [Brachybacterium sillae]MCS6712248.1 TetR/AcrR family transcriptional regulator [Brachybacterium sillae]